MNIIFLASCDFPYGEAYSSRALHLVKLLVDAGNKVHLIADYNKSGKSCNIVNFSFEILLDKNEPKERADKICITHLTNYLNNNMVDLVITNANSKRFNSIRKCCEKNSVPLVVENCEWYDKSNYVKGEQDPAYLANQKMINEDFKYANGFISISRLLDTHNKQFGKPTIRIPTILDFDEMRFKSKNNNERISVVYTGRAGKSKELFAPIFKALLSNKKLYKYIDLAIYGPSKLQVLRNIGYNLMLFVKAHGRIRIYGYVEQEKIQKIISDADYQIFIRPNRRSSHAGFPTKLAESMSVGTPVITNKTGDIELYVNNNINGFLLNDLNVSSIEDVFESILERTSQDRIGMRRNSRMCAEKSFDYRIYINDMKIFLKKVLENFES